MSHSIQTEARSHLLKHYTQRCGLCMFICLNTCQMYVLTSHPVRLAVFQHLLPTLQDFLQGCLELTGEDAVLISHLAGMQECARVRCRR